MSTTTTRTKPPNTPTATPRVLGEYYTLRWKDCTTVVRYDGEHQPALEVARCADAAIARKVALHLNTYAALLAATTMLAGRLTLAHRRLAALPVRGDEQAMDLAAIREGHAALRRAGVPPDTVGL